MGPNGGPGTPVIRGPTEYKSLVVLWDDDNGVMEWDDYALLEWDTAETATIPLTGDGWRLMLYYR